MSDIILAWLNDEIQLSRRISHFEEDFNNGYLFGELLQKYNQQLNFNEFQNRDDKKSKLKNFQLLFDTFAALGVTFNSNIANQIINKKIGVAKKVLYELKMYLQKTNSNAFTKITKMTKTLSPLKKIKVSKQQYDNVSKQHFVKQLNQLHPAQKTLNQQNLLKKFSDFHQKQKLVNIQHEQKDFMAKQSQQKKFREKQLDNLKKTSDFRNDWEKSNLQKWSANMTLRKMQNQKDSAFKTKLESSKFHNKTMAELNAIKLLDNDINQFQKKFLPKNDSDSEDQSNDKLPQSLQQDAFIKKQSKLSAKLRLGRTDNSFLQSSLKKKKQPQATQQSKHQREKKRRKMIVQQNKRYQLIQISRREKYIISTIQQTSKQQKQIQYQVWRVWQNRNVIKQNKTLKQDKQKQKEETKQINNKFKKDQLLKTYREDHQKQVADGVRRQNKYFNDYKVAQRKNTYHQCKRMVQTFVEMTEKCFKYQQQANKQQIQQSFLDHLFDQFIEGISVEKDVAELQLKNYIHGQGEWNISVKKPEEVTSDPTLQNAIPQKVTNNYYLGNILKFMFQKFYFSQSEQQQLKNTSPQFLISLLGLQFSGKHVIAQMIKDQFNFNVIQIEKLILDRLNQFESMKDKLSQVSTQTQELVDTCLSGKEIPNRLIVKLLQDQVRKNPKSVLLNYPITYEQAIDFTKTFGNVQPSDHIAPSKLQNKILSFSRLVWPTQSKKIAKPRTQCGLDFALWIDINAKTSLDRFLGRRWIKDQVVHIRQDISQNVDLLKVGQKGSSLILKNNQKIINMPKIKEWFVQFGIQIAQEQETFVQKAWESINGQKERQQLKNQVFLLVNRALQIKNKKSIKQQQKNIHKIQEQRAKKQLQQKEAQIKQMCVYSAPQTIKQKLQLALNSMQISKQFITTLCELWNKTQNQTVSSFKKVFAAFFNQEKQISNYISSVKRNYIQLLTRQDSKFSLVKQFQINYNNFFELNPDMVFQDYAKDQLHQRVDDLEDQIFNVIEQKKQDAIQQRKNIMQSGWLQAQMDQFQYGVRILLQAELSRYLASQKLISDFYSKKCMVPQKQYEYSAYQVNFDTTLQSYTKQNTFPRLQKLIVQTMRLFNKQEEVIDDKNKKGGKQPPKKDDKKGAKKGQVEQVKEPTAEQLQMKKAINTQKSIFRYRVNVVKSFALQKLKKIKEEGQKLYMNIEDYYLYTYKIQNKCVLNLSKILRKKIQDEKKIQNQIQINYVDIIETQLIRNFQRQKPVILPAKEKVTDDRFTIFNIKELMTWIQNQSEGYEKISTKKAIFFFQSFRKNQLSKSLLAQKWKSLREQNYQNFMRRIDPNSSGFIGLWKIIMFFIMTNFNVPSKKQLQQYANILTQYGTVWQISRQKFTQTAAWFDEDYQYQSNVRLFQRNIHIKNLLFDIFMVENKGEQFIHGQKLIEGISLRWLDNKQAFSGKTYFEYAFQ